MIRLSALVLVAASAAAVSLDDTGIVGGLDAQYQAAVKAHDVATMDRILAEGFILVTGRGRVFTKADLLQSARDTGVVYEHNEDTSRTVRLWGNTAVVTALLWEKGSDHGKPFAHRLWFSDTYVRTAAGWKYVFGQASLPLPDVR